MSNLIDRQAAIETVRKAQSIGQAHRMLLQLPPAQPSVSKTEMVGDAISRQAVWDALNRIEISRNASWYEFYQKALTAVGELPSAQPDIDVKFLIRTITTGIMATDTQDVYSCGMRNGMRWCRSLIDGKEPLYENCPYAQPEII